MKENLFEKILNILIWTLGIIVIYWLILKLTNHSPTIEQLTLGLVGIITTLMFKHENRISKLEEFKYYVNKEFNKIHNKLEKLDKLELNVHDLQYDVSQIKSDISFIRSRV